MRVPRSPDGIEVPHVFRVRQDEAPSRCNVRAEECVNRLGSGEAIVHGHPEQLPRLRIHGCVPELLRRHLPQPLVALDLAGRPAPLGNDMLAFFVIVRIDVPLAVGNAVERRLGDIEVPALDDGGHVAEKERQ